MYVWAAFVLLFVRFALLLRVRSTNRRQYVICININRNNAASDWAPILHSRIGSCRSMKIQQQKKQLAKRDAQAKLFIYRAIAHQFQSNFEWRTRARCCSRNRRGVLSSRNMWILLIANNCMCLSLVWVCCWQPEQECMASAHLSCLTFVPGSLSLRFGIAVYRVSHYLRICFFKRWKMRWVLPLKTC